MYARLLSELGQTPLLGNLYNVCQVAFHRPTGLVINSSTPQITKAPTHASSNSLHYLLTPQQCFFMFFLTQFGIRSLFKLAHTLFLRGRTASKKEALAPPGRSSRCRECFALATGSAGCFCWLWDRPSTIDSRELMAYAENGHRCRQNLPLGWFFLHWLTHTVWFLFVSWRRQPVWFYDLFWPGLLDLWDLNHEAWLCLRCSVSGSIWSFMNYGTMKNRRASSNGLEQYLVICIYWYLNTSVYGTTLKQ